MDLVKTCITWITWNGNHAVTKLKLEVLLLKVLGTLNDPHPVQMAIKVIREQLKCLPFLGLR